MAPRALWLPVAIAALLQALMWVALPVEFTPDSTLYQANVESLLATGTARNALGEPDTVLTPGYPLFLAPFLATGWIGSAPHRQNLEGSYDVTGIGIARDRDGATYATQLFVRR